MNQRHSRVLELQLLGYRLSTAEILTTCPLSAFADIPLATDGSRAKVSEIA